MPQPCRTTYSINLYEIREQENIIAQYMLYQWREFELKCTERS